MKIAIHHREGSFSSYWIEYCKKNSIPFKIVNAYADDIIKQLDDCDALMWHYHQDNISDNNVAKQMLYALQQSGKIVFPDFATGWYFDDKVGQKYLLEATDSPVVNSHVFLDKKSALEWCKSAKYPLVFKLRGGAGSFNVKLIKNYNEATKLINIAFGKGFPRRNLAHTVTYSWEKLKSKRITLRNFINLNVSELLWHINPNKVNHKETGYIYFQEFIPDNDHDIRVIVIGERAFAIKRMCRENDFRASGSGKMIYDCNQIPDECVSLSFKTARKLRSRCIGFDWVINEDGDFKIVEIGYGFMAKAYFDCEGYWTSDMQWHEESEFDFCGWMVDEVIQEIAHKGLAKSVSEIDA